MRLKMHVKKPKKSAVLILSHLFAYFSSKCIYYIKVMQIINYFDISYNTEITDTIINHCIDTTRSETYNLIKDTFCPYRYILPLKFQNLNAG